MATDILIAGPSAEGASMDKLRDLANGERKHIGINDARAICDLYEHQANKVRNLTSQLDEQVGTPCAQIRWQDRECELLAHICGNASMEDWRIDEMSADQMRDLLKYLAKDARKLSGYADPKDAAAWVEAYADGRI